MIRKEVLGFLGACVAIWVVSIAQASVAADGAWTVKTPMPVSRYGIHVAAVAGRIYVIGGEHAQPNAAPTGAVEVYDPVTDMWTHAASMPTARGFFATAVVDGRIFAIGGSLNMVLRDPATARVEIYDPKTNRWSQGTDMPTPRADLTASVVNGRIYAIGGTRHVGIDALGIVEEYDPGTDNWTRKADMPTPRLHLSSAVVDNRIYVFGGSPQWAVPLGAAEMYDPVTDTWTKLPDMPTERTGVWAAALDDKIYVCGGVSWETTALATVEA